nr:sensor histidine kinase [Microbacterium pseudoresistens]
MSDAALAVAVALVICVVIAADQSRSSPLEGYVCAVGFGALLLLRRRMPRTVLVVTILAIFAYYTAGFPPIGMVLPAVGALYSAAELHRTGWAIAAAAVLIGVASFFRLDGTEPDASFNGYTFMTELALAAAAIALGAAVRLTREARERTHRIAELTAAEQRHAADARLQAERMRIARDLHDTIGHTLSVASLHSGVAGEAIGHDDTAAHAALERVRAATTEALREVRRTVKVLRDDDSVAPSPGLAAVETLLSAAREAGLEVDAHIDVPAEALDASTDAAAYRIVQESLTNVIRHSGARKVHVHAGIDGGRLALRIADDGGRSPRATPDTASGAGIRGMRERAALLGGTLTAAPTAGGFVVEAHLPLRAREEDA